MANKIYFSKIEYREVLGYGNTSSILLLNIPEHELSYQEFRWKKRMPAITGIESEIIGDHTYYFDFVKPAMMVNNCKTNYKDILVADDLEEEEVVFSFVEKLSDHQITELLPYCNAFDFEPFRDKEMRFDDEGYIGYRDGVRLYFRAITSSYIPMIELPMDCYYDEAHIWPSEKLYRYLIKTYFEKNKKYKRTWPVYGGLSLFG